MWLTSTHLFLVVLLHLIDAALQNCSKSIEAFYKKRKSIDEIEKMF